MVELDEHQALIDGSHARIGTHIGNDITHPDRWRLSQDRGLRKRPRASIAFFDAE